GGQGLFAGLGLADHPAARQVGDQRLESDRLERHARHEQRRAPDAETGERSREGPRLHRVPPAAVIGARTASRPRARAVAGFTTTRVRASGTGGRSPGRAPSLILRTRSAARPPTHAYSGATAIRPPACTRASDNTSNGRRRSSECCSRNWMTYGDA